MTITIGFISNKGGTGKSTLSRALARELVVAGQKVLFADMDYQHQTALKWSQQRNGNLILPRIDIASFKNISDLLPYKRGDSFIIVDGPSRDLSSTIEIAKFADLNIQPCGPTRDDLEPAMHMFHTLLSERVDYKKCAFALFRSSSKGQEEEARNYLMTEFEHPISSEKFHYHVLNGSLPNKVEYASSLDEGKTVTETSSENSNDEAAILIKDIVQWMIVANA